MGRIDRQQKILELIAMHEIDTQEEIAEFLKSEGFKITQATVSRDIRDLNIVKVARDSGKGFRYTSQQQSVVNDDKFKDFFKDAVLSIHSSMSLVIIKTESGSAMTCGAFLDNLGIEQIVGVISGDDTLFVAVDSLENVGSVINRLEQYLN